MVLKSAYVKNYDGETKLINFFIKYDDLLQKCNDSRNKVRNSIKKNLIVSLSTTKTF